MRVAESDVKIALRHHPPGHRRGVSRHPNEAAQAGLPQPDQFPICLAERSFQVDELDIVQLQDVDVIGAQQPEALLKAAPDSLRGEVELPGP